MSVSIFQLVGGEDTLYGENPLTIAEQVRDKLNTLAQQGWAIHSVASLPDYHNWGRDGGVKKILFVCSADNTAVSDTWDVRLVINSSGTMHGWETAQIIEELTNTIADIEKNKGIIEHIVPLLDHHELSIFEGVGGYDGVKNIIICIVQTKHPPT